MQMTVRLTDDAAADVDRLVGEGSFVSRAAYLNWLVQRDSMRRRSLADLDRLRELAGGPDADPYPEFAGLREFAARESVSPE